MVVYFVCFVIAFPFACFFKLIFGGLGFPGLRLSGASMV